MLYISAMPHMKKRLASARGAGCRDDVHQRRGRPATDADARPTRRAGPARRAGAACPARSATAPSESSESPQRTTATYDDWVVQCETRTGPPPEKICDMAQVTQVQGRNTPFSRVAVVHPVKGQPAKLIVQVPVNASFAAPVRIAAGESDAGIASPFARCVPAGCFSEIELHEDVLRKFRAASGAGKSPLPMPAAAT